MGGASLTYLVNVRIILGMSRLPFEPRKIKSVAPHDGGGDLFGAGGKGSGGKNGGKNGGKDGGLGGEAMSVSGLAGMIKGVISGQYAW